MYKRFILPLLQAEKRIDGNRRNAQWQQLRDISLIFIAGLMIFSILNLIRRDYVMLAATVGASAVLGCVLHDCWASKEVNALKWAYTVIFPLLCTYSIIWGGNDGCAILWVMFVPFLFILMIDTVKGVLLSVYLLLLLFLVFYWPLDFLLQYDYPDVVRLYFPIFYAIDCILSIYCAVKLIWTRNDLIIAQEQARAASFLDASTGLKNRTAFTHFVQTAPQRNFIRMTMIYIDVNGLHELNNRLGHAAGDEMLRFVANACVNRFPQADVFRLGGDEFLIACSMGTEREISVWMDDLIRTIESAGYTIAYGIEYRLHDLDLEDMVNKADAKMLKNKAEYYRTRDRHQR